MEHNLIFQMVHRRHLKTILCHFPHAVCLRAYNRILVSEILDKKKMLSYGGHTASNDYGYNMGTLTCVSVLTRAQFIIC